MRWILPIAICVTLFLTSGQSKLATHDIQISHFDKIGHFFVFGLLATAFYRIPFFWNLKMIGLLTVLLLVTSFGISDEIHQYFVPNRYVEYGDLVMDFTGALIALLVYRYWHFYRMILETPLFGTGKKHTVKKGYLRSFGESDSPLTKV